MSNQRCGSPFTTEQVWEIRGAGNLKNPLTNISTCSAYHRLLPILIPHRLHLSRSNVSWPAVCLTVYPPFFPLQISPYPLFTMRPLGLSTHRVAYRWGCRGTSARFQIGAQRIAAQPLILPLCSKLRPGRWMSAERARSRDPSERIRAAHCLILAFLLLTNFVYKMNYRWTTPPVKWWSVTTDPPGFQNFHLFVQK